MLNSELVINLDQVTLDESRMNTVISVGFSVEFVFTVLSSA